MDNKAYKRILFIEDNKIKANSIIKFLKESYNVDFEIILKDAYRNGLKEIFTNDYDLLLLDMSLPTRDEYQSLVNDGYERYGGYNIMMELKRKKKYIPTILVTMFNEFGGESTFINLEDLDNICKERFPSFYKDYVFYSSGEENWKFKLINLLNSIEHK